MRRYKKRSRRWKRIWRGDGVSGGGSKLQNWILRLTPDNGIYRALGSRFASAAMKECDNRHYWDFLHQYDTNPI